jgi:hypothetical protein
MLLESLLAEGVQIDWVGVVIALAVLAVGWVLLKFVLRLTLKVFACGGIILLALAGIGFAVVYWDQIAVWFQ